MTDDKERLQEDLIESGKEGGRKQRKEEERVEERKQNRCVREKEESGV